ncbi:MAG: glycosyltransferase [Treponemataceae bacterium]
MKNTLDKYLRTKSIYCSKNFQSSFSIAVCIPAYNEYPTIIKTLQSLAVSCAVCKVKVHVVICINDRESTTIEVKQNNQYCIQMLKRIAENEFFIDENSISGIKITVLDYTKKEKQFTGEQGVGMARKIAMDYALSCGAKVIASLDADTLVSQDYCGELKKFLDKKLDFATMDFAHQQASSSQLQEAIDAYEFWMKDHFLQLRKTGTPFYHMALGCIIVVSDKMYAQIGGMKNRLAGEDFYFIQEAIKIMLTRTTEYDLGKNFQNIVPYLNCQVYPQARISDRVLFGTGKTLEKINSGNKKIRFYKESSYETIKNFISFFYSQNDGNGNMLKFPQKVLESSCDLNPKLVEFLINDSFFSNWDLIIKNNKNNPLKNAVSFHCKFDGLKIIRTIHFLEN